MTRDGGEDISELKERLEKLKSESRSLDAEIASAAPPPCGAAVLNYSSMVQAPVHLHNRGAMIRRAGAVAVAFMAVVLIVTMVLPGQEIGEEQGGMDVLLGGDGMQQALRAVEPELTEGERKLFANDAKQLSQVEAAHRRQERERASHLLRMITATVDHNEKHAALERLIREKAKQHREGMKSYREDQHKIRDNDRATGHRQKNFKAVNRAMQQLTTQGHEGPPIKGLTGEIDHAFHQQVLNEQEEAQEAQERKESRFMSAREAAKMARETKERAVDDARAMYHEARLGVIKAKDELKDALAQRDATTEKVRTEGFISEKEALAQLAPVQNKVNQLLQQVITAKSKWESARSELTSAESGADTRPQLSFPPLFQHSAAQQLVLTHKSSAVEQRVGFLSARAAVKSAFSAAVHAQDELDEESLRAPHAHTTSGHVSHASSTPALPVLNPLAQLLHHRAVESARHRLAIKAGLTGSLEKMQAVKTADDFQDNMVKIVPASTAFSAQPHALKSLSPPSLPAAKPVSPKETSVESVRHRLAIKAGSSGQTPLDSLGVQGDEMVRVDAGNTPAGVSWTPNMYKVASGIQVLATKPK